MDKKKKTSLIRAALYIRVSTEEQALHGYSLEAQREALTRYARENDLLIADYYVDEGKSARGKIQNRTAFQRLMRDVQADKIDLILFIKLDRWFRSIKDYYKTQEILEAHHVDWRATEEQYDTSTTNGRLHINIRLAIAQDEADRASDRIKFVFASKVERGEVITGSVPIGFKIENKRLVHNPETVDMVRDLFQHYQTYGSKHGSIKYIFRKYGVAIPQGNFSRMIANPLYKGEYRGIKNYCEPIIEPAVWDQLNAIVNIYHPRMGRVYIFSGLIVCAECGCRMIGRYNTFSASHPEVFYYRCNHYTNFRSCPNKKMLRETTLETWLMNNIEDKIAAYLWECEAKAVQKPKPAIDRMAIQKKLTRLKELYVNEMIDMKTYKADYDVYITQLAEIQEPEQPPADLNALRTFLHNGFDKVAYQALSREERRTMWRSIIKEIRVDLQQNLSIFFV